MMARQFSDSFAGRLQMASARSGSLLCIGLDPDLDRLPEPLRLRPPGEAIIEFNRAIIDATRDLVCAYKPNLGFYLQYGLEGHRALVETVASIPRDIPIVLDAKVGDIGSTASAYARAYFDELGVDAITANPYLGEDSLQPFFAYRNRGVILLCKTSNPGSGDIQDLPVAGSGGSRPLYLKLADSARAWATRADATVGLVVGATWPAQLAEVRTVAPNLPILLPGIGAQAGELEAAVRAGLSSSGDGLLVSASRAVLYAGGGEDYADRAREAAQILHRAIEAARAPEAAQATGL